MLTEQQKVLVKATVPILRESGVALTDYFYKRMLNNNPELKETFNMGHQRSGAQASALAGAVLAYAENIDDPMVLAPVVELICNKHVSLNIQAPDYNIVGENLLYSISEVLSIPMDAPLIDAWKAAYFQLADLFIATEKKLYEEQAAKVGSWVGWRNFVVDKKVRESNEVTSYYFVPEDGKAIPLFKPGQYVTVRVYVSELGIKQPRQYSLSNMPGEDFLRISVKREDPHQEGQNPGYVSSTLHNIINEKDVVELTAPIGNFVLVNPSNVNVLISAGVGLTPMVSMLKSLSNQSSKAVHFIHTSRGSTAHALRDEVKGIASSNDTVKLHINYRNISSTDVQGEDYHTHGHLNLNDLSADWLPADADYYLCGPIAFMQEKRKELVEFGISNDRIHSEAFSTGGVPA
ncbi:NO-inducible flavohemoprotein [Rahnella sp. BCC 1045]|nr:NO-inducible flavohemoprotein [Rahnella sp. BCC 1045]